MPSNLQESTRERVIAAATEMTRLPLLPEFAQHVLQIARQSPDDIDISEVAEIVSSDSALVARVLRIANSPFYSLKSRVASVRQAMVTIGLNDFMGLMLATSILNRFKVESSLKNLDLSQFWVHTLAVGAAARTLATAERPPMLSSTEANLAALLHDIGKSLFYAAFPGRYDQCLHKMQSSRRLLEETEEEEMGISHADLGGIMADQWQLPAFIASAIRHHHAPQAAEEPWRECAWLVARADNFVITEKIGQSGNRARTTAEMETIRPKANGKIHPPPNLSIELRPRVLKDVEHTLKAALIQWEMAAEPSDPAHPAKAHSAGQSDSPSLAKAAANQTRSGNQAGMAAPLAWFRRLLQILGQGK